MVQRSAAIDPVHLYELTFAGIDGKQASALLAHFNPESLGDLPRDMSEYRSIPQVGDRSAFQAIEVSGQRPIDSDAEEIDVTDE